MNDNFYRQKKKEKKESQKKKEKRAILPQILTDVKVKKQDAREKTLDADIRRLKTVEKDIRQDA